MRTRLWRALVGTKQMAPLAIAHGIAAAADTFVTVSLAKSLFFNLSPSASRREVLLYLLVTMAPLAVLAPLVGPAVDRFRARPHWMAAFTYLLRAVFCVGLGTSLYELSFYAYAVGLLACSKASGVIKQALVPLVTYKREDLVSANALLARISTLGGAIGGATAIGLLTISTATWILNVAAVPFVAAAVAVGRLRPDRPDDEVSVIRVDAEMHLPTITVGSVGFMAIRGAVGFFVFTMAFALRSASEPPWVYGFAIGAYGAGATLGNFVSPLLRRRVSEQTLLAASLAAPAALSLVGVLGVPRALLLSVAAVIGLSTTLGRHAFDSLLQHRAPEAARGRAGARFETRFSLAYVAGSVLATPMSLPVQASMAVLSAIYIPTLFVFVRAFSNARRLEHESVSSAALAAERLLVAEAHLRRGDYLWAVIDAAAAADFAQLAGVEIDDRRELDVLRDDAVRRAAHLGSAEAMRAVGLVSQWLSLAGELAPSTQLPRPASPTG